MTEPASLLLDCPRWMRWRWAQWLGSRVPFVARIWKREMDAALEREAEFEHSVRRELLLVTLNCWAARSFAGDAIGSNIVEAWCAWRNAAERLHRYRERRAGHRIDRPLMLVGLPSEDT